MSDDTIPDMRGTVGVFKLLEERISSLCKKVDDGFSQLRASMAEARAADDSRRASMERDLVAVESRLRAIELGEAECRANRVSIHQLQTQLDKFKEDVVSNRVKVTMIVAALSVVLSSVVALAARMFS